MIADVTFESYKEEWLVDIREGDPSTTELGHGFARKLLTQWRQIDDFSDDLVYCDGAGDGGIDIAYLERGEEAVGEDEDTTAIDGDTWYLVQSKYGSAFRGTDTLLQEGQKVIDTLDGQRDRLSSLAEGLLERLNTFRGQASERDRLILVFATEEPLDAKQKRVLDDLRAMGRERLGSIFEVESVSIETIYLRTLEDTTAGGLLHLKVPLRADLAQSGEELLIGAVSLLSLYDFLKSYRDSTEDLDQLYEKNVRRFLGPRGKVNRAMQKTLREEPERFGLYNNGITMVVTDFESGEDGEITLVEPYVVNGAQTTRTIWDYLHQHLEAGGTGVNPEMQEWLGKVKRGVVVAKIVRVAANDEGLLEKITRYTNSQNAVREKDFLALTKDFKTWQRQMAEQYDVYLEVQRGGWDSQRALQRQNPNIPQYKEVANAFNLLKVYGAGWLGEAGIAFGKNAPFTPNGWIFKKLVNNEVGDNPFGVQDLYAAYRLQKAADKYQFGRGAPKAARRQTRFLFYMVVVELLKDILIRSEVSSSPSTDSYTQALLKLFEPGNEPAIEALLDTAVEVVDEYLTPGAEYSVFLEPAFQNAFNNDLNAYLKWDKLGKSEETSPWLRNLLAITRAAMGRGMGSQSSPRDLITAAIRMQ